MSLSKNGFTLIELLVVISIIALLSTVALTSVNGQRNRAKDVSFQSTVKSIQGAAEICCNGGAGALQTVLGADICNPVSGSLYPGANSIGSVEVIRGCGDIAGFNIRITPGTSNAGLIQYALCDRDRCDYTYLSS